MNVCFMFGHQELSSLKDILIKKKKKVAFNLLYINKICDS